MDKMRYSKIDKFEICNGEDVGVSLYTQGCPIKCQGCFNLETWDFDGGYLLTTKEEKLIYQYLKEKSIKRFSVLGGEPLIKKNLFQLNYILCTIKTNWPDKKIWIYSGYTWEQLQEKRKKDIYLYITFKYSDILIAGPYIENQKDLTLQWRGSSNQEIIDIQKSLKQKEKVLYVK